MNSPYVFGGHKKFSKSWDEMSYTIPTVSNHLSRTNIDGASLEKECCFYLDICVGGSRRGDSFQPITCATISKNLSPSIIYKLPTTLLCGKGVALSLLYTSLWVLKEQCSISSCSYDESQKLRGKGLRRLPLLHGEDFFCCHSQQNQ